jgi:flagellar L-ring protein precursor FlgH
MGNLSKSMFLAVLALLFVGCANKSEVRQLAPAMSRPAAAGPQAEATGAIYRGDTPQRGLFADRRARFVGDVITIVLQESVSSTKRAATKLSRKESINNSVGAVSKLPLKTLQGLNFSSSEAESADNNGSSSQSGVFTGTIATTVAEVLPNGNLVVAGDKEIQINYGVQHLRFSGIVNPLNVRPDNSVFSTAVANARLEYREDGTLGDNAILGGLMRFFIKASTLF